MRTVKLLDAWMLFTILLFISTFNTSTFAQSTNWKGNKDTTVVYISDTTTIKFSKVYQMSEGENQRVDIYCNDTAKAGFSTDSTKIVYGYQTGHVSFKNDTTWNERDTVDIVDNTKYQTGASYGRWNSDGTITQTYGYADTSGTYARQTHGYSPYWDVLIRYWCHGATGTNLTTANKVIIQHLQRVGSIVKQK